MTPYALLTPVTVTTVHDGQIARVCGEIRGRTLEAAPRYDVIARGKMILNAPHADLEAMGAAPAVTVNEAGVLQIAA